MPHRLPTTGSSYHEAYTTRQLVRDQVEAMRELGYDRFHVVGHDRKARADDLRGSAVAAGHFLAEEAAEETARQLLDFLG